MSDWREIHADQNLRIADKMLEQQGEIKRLLDENEQLRERLGKIYDLTKFLSHGAAREIAALTGSCSVIADSPTPDEPTKGQP